MRYSFRFLGIAAVLAASAALAQGTIMISPLAQMANACDAGTGSACYELGEKLRFGNDVGKDEPRARRLHERGCSLNEARSCFRLGTMTVRGDGGPRDSAGARAAYEKSCSLDNSDGCSAVGSVFAIGVGVPIDMTRAAIAYQKACRLEPSSDYICTKARETASYLPARQTQTQTQAQAERPQVAQVSASAPHLTGVSTGPSQPAGTQCRAAASLFLRVGTGPLATLSMLVALRPSAENSQLLAAKQAEITRATGVSTKYAAARVPNAQELTAMDSMPLNQINALLQRCAEAPTVSSAASTARPNAPPVVTSSPLPRSSQISPPNLAANSPTTAGASQTNSVTTGQATSVTPRSCTVNATQAISFYRTLIPTVERQVLDGVSPAFRADARTRLVGYRENLALAQAVVRAYPSTSLPTEAENNAAKDMVLGARRRILEQCATQRRVTWESSNSPNVQSTQVAQPNGSSPSGNAQLPEGLRVIDMTASDTLVGTSRVKYFEFQAQPMMGVNITASAPSGSASFLTIERAMPDRQWLIVMTQNMPDGLIGTILESGRHRLAVSASNRATGRFDLGVRTTEPARNVPPLQRTQTGQITNASFRSGAVTGQAYKTAAKAGQIFEFQAAAIGFEIELLAIMSDVPEQISGNLQRTATLRYVAPKDGTLLINVVTRTGQTGRYTLTASAQAAPVPSPVSATSSAQRPPAQNPSAPPTPKATPNAGQSLDQRARSLRADQPVEARRLYEQSCTSGSAAGCFGLGWMLHNSRGGAGDRPRALGLIERACTGNIGEACDYLGYIHEYGSGIAKDETKARVHYQKSCALSFPEGCLNFALLQLDGRGGVKDERAARSNLEQSCRLGDRVGCSTLASVRTSGKGGAVDLAGATTAKRRACELGLTSECTN